MPTPDAPAPPGPAFDDYADHYAHAVERGTSVSGESPEFFARGRVAALRKRLDDAGIRVRSVLDFGCGTGTALPILGELLGADDVVGVDVSERSLAVARRANPGARCVLPQELPAGAAFDVVYCNGVFHHLAPEERGGALAFVRDRLRPGGRFALWENNPWNPGTRLVMSRIPFDRDAETLSAPAARRLVRSAGFAVEATDFAFVFPRPLRALRFLEPGLARLPVGAQYLVLARRPE